MNHTSTVVGNYVESTGLGKTETILSGGKTVNIVDGLTVNISNGEQRVITSGNWYLTVTSGAVTINAPSGGVGITGSATISGGLNVGGNLNVLGNIQGAEITATTKFASPDGLDIATIDPASHSH